MVKIADKTAIWHQSSKVAGLSQGFHTVESGLVRAASPVVGNIVVDADFDKGRPGRLGYFADQLFKRIQQLSQTRLTGACGRQSADNLRL